MVIHILEDQRSLTQVGELRIGESLPVPGRDYRRPAKLNVFKGTSQHRELIEALAAMAGGKVVPWQPQGIGRPGWAVTTEAKKLHVILPPYDEYSQFMEHWVGGRCLRRCDSRVILNQGGKPCVCDLTKGAERTKDTCKPTTRINVMLYNPDTDQLLSVGVWKLESKGWGTGDKVPLQMAMIRRLTPPGQLVRATVELRDDSKMIPNPRKPGEFQLSVWKEFLFLPIGGTASMVTGTAGLREIEGAPVPVSETLANPPVIEAAELVADGADVEPPMDADEVEATAVEVPESELIAGINKITDVNHLRRIYRELEREGWLTPAVIEAARERQAFLAPPPAEPAGPADGPADVPAEGAAVTTRDASLMEALAAAGSRGWTQDQFATEFEVFTRKAGGGDVALHDATGAQLRAFARHLTAVSPVNA